jgi:hypothetical protein
VIVLTPPPWTWPMNITGASAAKYAPRANG